MSNTVTKEQQRAEAIDRLHILEEQGLMPQVRKDFEQDRLNYSECLAFSASNACGILYRVSEDPRFARAIRDLEEMTGGVAYHATHERFEFGEVLDIFYVSDCEEEWEQDRADLREGYSFVFAANLSDSWLSEHGSIAFNVSGGGLIRVA